MEEDEDENQRVTFTQDEKKNQQETQISEIRSVGKVSPTNVIHVKPSIQNESIVEYQDLDSPVKLRKNSSGLVYR